MDTWTSSNSLVNTASYDTDGRLTGISVPGVQSLGFSYDVVDRIIKVGNGIHPSYTQNFGYDAMSRLVSVYSGADSESFQYDANGNRLAQTGVLNAFSATSNRLLSSGTTQYGYDAKGNTTTVNATPTYHYDAFNRMDSAGGMTYYVNPEGQRMRKSGAVGTTYFAYGPGGALLAENVNGAWVDYVWLNGRLIGRIANGQTYAVHADQTGRPETVTDASRTVVWQAQNLAFTRNVTKANITLNIGFPGQYYDAETDKWNNGYRDYDARLGRYVESDPIGLMGGVNTYAYVGNSPAMYIDPYGLEWQFSVGVGGTMGAIFGFGGGGVNVGFTSNGALFVQFEGHAEVGLGIYAGIGIQGGVSRTQCDSKPGWSKSTMPVIEGNMGHGPSVGGGATFNGHDVGASAGLGRLGLGAGIMGGVGASRTYTYTTSSIFQM